VEFAQGNRGGPSALAQSPVDVCWVFDVDGCLVDSLTGTSLRPGARDIVTHLAAQARVLLWSAGGGDYARARAVQFGIAEYFNGFYPKDGRDEAGHYSTSHLPTAPGRSVFVDDRPEDLAESLEVLVVSPYLADDPHDRGLEAVARRAGLESFATGATPCSRGVRAEAD
jgi:long-chain acyl-CoA synthetase